MGCKLSLIATIVLIGYLTCVLLAKPESYFDALDIEEVKGYTKVLSAFGSRFTGYIGYYNAISYINSTLRLLNLNPQFLEFTATVPFDYGATIRVANYSLKIYHLYPNLVALGAATNVSGQLVYVGKGSFDELEGIDLRGKIAVIEFDSDWAAVAAKGPAAIVFLGPVPDRVSALKKISLAPLDIPRVYVRSEDAEVVRKAAKEGFQAIIEGRYEWRRVSAYNILVEIPGTSEPEKVVILAAHIDSGSIVPALAPGAEEAVNVAVLLHLARLFKEHPPRYTVWLLFLSGHWQGLAGAREFVEKVIFSERVGREVFPYILFNFDLSSGDSKLAVYPGGFFYGHRTQGAMNLYADFRYSLMDILKEFYQKYPDDYEKIKSSAMEYNATTNLVFLRSFNTGYAIPYSQPFYLDAEPFQLAKIPAISFLTFQDTRPTVFTPNDVYERLNWQHLEPQIRFALFTLDKVLNDISTVFRGSWDTIKPRRIEVDPVNGGFGFVSVYVDVVEYDPTVPTLYKPVSNALVVVYKRDWYYNVMGSLAVTQFDPPYGKIVEMTDEMGRARIVGLAPPEIFIGNVEVYAYKVENGRLVYVPDMGPNGLARFLPYPPKLSMDTVLKAVAFKAAGLLAPFIAVPDKPWPLATFNMYGKASYVIPYTRYVSPYPVSISIFYPNLAPPDSYYYAIDYVNRFAVIYAPPDTRICAIVGVGSEQRRSVMLLNLSEGNINGYKLGRAGSLQFVVHAFQTYIAELMSLARERYGKAEASGVYDPTSAELMKRVEGYGSVAKLGSTWAAWSSALQLYERTRGMSLDFATATLIVMLMIVPFAVLGEKLFFGRGGVWRLAYIVLVAAATFAVFALLHPGFSIVYSTYALSLAVVMAALSIPALFFMFLLFNRSLSQVRRERLGVHALERETFDLLVAAMATGIENMRRRPLRTVLTLVTVVLVVMSLIALTSVVPILKVMASSYESQATFSGILIKSPSHEPIDPIAVDVLANLVGSKYVIAPRYWLYPPIVGEEFILTSGKGSTTFAAAMGLAPAELNGSLKELGVDPTVFSRITSSCLLPKTIASALGVDIGDTVRFAGYELLVAGVFDDSLAEQVVRDIADRAGERAYGDRPFDLVTITQVQRLDETARLPWSSLVIINAEVMKELPGSFIHSIVLLPKNSVGEMELATTAEEIYRVFSGFEVHAGSEGKAILISSRYVQEFFGFNFIIVPMLISGMVLMTTILGSIHERIREAWTYSALGLAPTQVGGMFLAEVIAYAVLGVTLGYAFGIAFARATNFAVLTGGVIGMNYSSSSVLVSLAVTFLMVLLSAFYPFLRVSKLVTPSLERKWKIPTKARGDVWEVPLPFTFKEWEMVAGLVMYLCEFFENRRERIGTFAVMNYEPYSEPGKVGVRATIWLAPYEQNLVQEVDIALVKSVTEARYVTVMTAKRASGPYDTWLKSSEIFIRELREQFLTWRLLSPGERSSYIERGKKLVRMHE